MMKSTTVVLLCSALFAYAGEFGKHGLRRARRDELPRAMPPPEYNTTIFKLHNYLLKATTTIEHHGQEDGGKIVEHLKARFSWDYIHHDLESHVITRYKLLECLEGRCGSVQANKSHFIEIRQGKQTIQNVWKNKTDPHPQWNILHSIIMTLTLPIEDQSENWQRAQTPFGECQYRFGRRNDTQYMREVRGCNFDTHQNRSLLNGLFQVDYESDVEVNMNAKYNGKLRLVRSKEKFRLYSPLHSQFGYTIHTEIRIELESNDDPYHLRYCNGTWPSSRCATEMFELESIGKTWSELMRTIEFKQESKGHVLLDDPKSNADVFLDICRLVQEMTPDDLLSLLNTTVEEYHKIQHLQAYAAVGEIDLSLFKQRLSERHFETYLQALGHRVGDEKLALQEVKKLLNDDHSSLSVHVFASLVNRDCHKTPSRLNNCNTADNKNILKLFEQMACGEKCDEYATYAAMEQIRIERICKHAAQFICVSPADVHGYILNILDGCNPTIFMTKDIRLLMNVFHNSCHKPVQDSWSLQALDILLKSYHKQPLAGTLLLRSEVEALEKPEKWAYFHQAERALLKTNWRAVEDWQQLRSFKVFKRNYNNHAIKGNEQMDSYLLKVKHLGRLVITVKQVGSNQTRQNSLQMTWQKDPNTEIDLLHLRKTQKEARLMLLGTAYSAFKWEDGQINVRLSDVEGHVPLLSGPFLNIHSTAILSLDFRPIRDSIADFQLSAHLKIISHTETRGHLLGSSIDIQTCLSLKQGHVDVGELDIRQSSDTDGNGRRRHIVYPAKCLRKVN